MQSNHINEFLPFTPTPTLDGDWLSATRAENGPDPDIETRYATSSEPR